MTDDTDIRGPFAGYAEEAAAAPSPEELAAFDLTAIGHAKRLIRLSGGQFTSDGETDLRDATLLFVPERGWVAFNGRFWDAERGELLARRLAHRIVEGLKAEGQRQLLMDRVGAKAYFAAIDAASSTGGTAGMIKQAEIYLAVRADDFDRDPLALNVRNGTLKFRRDDDGKLAVRFVRHNPSDRITRMAEVDYDAKAGSPVWIKSMAEWLPDEAVRRFVQALIGYCCTGLTHEQVFVIFQGLGRDGKSTLVGLLRELQGTYAAAADVKTFLDAGMRSGGDANADIARLAGDTRLISTAEPPRSAKLAEAMIKSFTGGAPILARRLHKEFFEFTPAGKVIMECNSRPQIKGDDEGIWRRLILILFENQVPKDKVDKGLTARLREETSGVLNWIIEGLGIYLSEGLIQPERVLTAIEDYRKGSSPFGEWLMSRVEIDKDAKVEASILYDDYKRWMLAQGHEDRQVMSQRAFGSALADRQIIRCGTNGQGRVMRSGARLRPDDEVASESVSSSGGSSPEAGGQPMTDADLDRLWGGEDD